MAHHPNPGNYFGGDCSETLSDPHKQEPIYPFPCYESIDPYHHRLSNMTFGHEYHHDEQNYNGGDRFANINTAPNIRDFWDGWDRAPSRTLERRDGIYYPNDPLKQSPEGQCNNNDDHNRHQHPNIPKHPPHKQDGTYTFSPTSVASMPSNFATSSDYHDSRDAFDALSFSVSESSGTESFQRHCYQDADDYKLPAVSNQHYQHHSRPILDEEAPFKPQKGLSFRVQKALFNKHEKQLAISAEKKVHQEASTLKATSKIEVAPGQFLNLRGAQETWQAVNDDFFLPCSCVICDQTIFCIADADYVLCPVCRVVNPVDFGTETSGSGGVGLGFTLDDLAKWHAEIARQW